MKCEVCSKEAETIVHFDGVDRCLKCDDKKEIDTKVPKNEY